MNIPNVDTEKDSDITLKSSVIWAPKVSFFDADVKRINRPELKVAAIIGTRLFEGLKYECALSLLTPETCEETLSLGNFDFLLIESTWNTVTGDWYLAQMNDNVSYLVDIVKMAKQKGIPTVFWNTQDEKYMHYYEEFSRYFDAVFCADPLVADMWRKKGISAEVLLPAMQPIVHNPFKNYNDAYAYDFSVVFDGWADILRMGNRLTFLSQLKEKGLKIIDSSYRFFNAKVSDTVGYERHILGSVTDDARIMALKYTKLLVDSSLTISTRTRKQWLSVEAAAVRVPQLHYGSLEETDIRRSFVESFLDEKEMFQRAMVFLENDIKRESVAQRSWREVNMHHSYAHRIGTVCSHLNINDDWEEFPFVSIIIATFRLNLLEECISRYEQQSYPNKELVLVVNSNEFSPEEADDLMRKHKNTRVFVLPSERVEGGCLNFAIAASKGKYCIKMDDDDHYSKNFVLDMVLHNRAIDADVFGKGNDFIHFEDDDTTYERKGRPPLTMVPKERLLEAHISGNSLSGKREFLQKHYYSDKNFASTDTCFHGNLQVQGRYALFDRLGLVMERSADVTQHSWRLEADKLKAKMKFLANGVPEELLS